MLVLQVSVPSSNQYRSEPDWLDATTEHLVDVGRWLSEQRTSSLENAIDRLLSELRPKQFDPTPYMGGQHP